MLNDNYHNIESSLVNLIQENDDYDIIDIIETVSTQHNIDRDDVEEMYENLYPTNGGSSMNTQHYHHVPTIQGVKDRAIRIIKRSTGKYQVRGNKRIHHMFHDVKGYDLVTFSFCHEEGRWILIGYDVNDNIVEIFINN